MKTLRKQAGVALVTAIFLLVVLAGLAVAVVSLSGAQQDTAVKDEMGTRAYLAAKAGMEWALFTALQGTGATKFDRLNCAGGPQTFRLPRGTTLSAFNVTVECSAQGPDYGSASTADHFRITVTACNAAACPAANPGADYVQRQITAQL
ncbi:MAG TPA: agglutinin biogenesis protein MshP [Duganella sp.]|nr:agglutinin biogenesis protein MshP [Duganella sp.]